MILYDSNKSKLSSLSLSSKSKVTVKSNDFISYYDDQRNYWSLYGAPNEIKTITDLLKSLDVTMNTSTETDNKPPEPITNKEIQSLQEDSTKQVESDTDTSIHRKMKASILNRMANMGHSVLPPSAVSVEVEKTSDSSDTNDTDYHIKAVRHKPVKGIIKKNNIDKTMADHKKIIDIHTSAESSRHMTDIRAFTSDQLVPLVNTSIVSSSSGNDMHVFITEQKISNTELRINMGKISDKMDHLVTKINQLDVKNQTEGAAEINTEIIHKLLREYETKIKKYEELFKTIGTDISLQRMTAPKNDLSICRNEEALKNRIEELEKTVNEKNNKILLCQNEIKILRDEKDQQLNVLEVKVSELEAELNSKQILLEDLTEANKELIKTSSISNVENKIKSLMNDTYQAAATNFENGETYSGESTKKIIAMVIKKVTISALNDAANG